MAESLGDIGKTFTDLADAAKTTKKLVSANGTLNRIITETKKQAEAVERIDMPGEDQLVHLKDQLRTVDDNASGIETFCMTFNKQSEELDNLLKKITQAGAVSDRHVKACAGQLDRMYNMITDFATAFSDFYKSLQAAHQTASKFYSHLAAQEKKAREEARSARKWGVAKSVGLAALSAGAAAALYYFAVPTGGATLPLAAKLGGVALGAAATAAAVGAGYCGVNAYLDFDKLTGIADKFKSQANEIKTFAEELNVISQRAGRQEKLNADTVNALKVALNFYQRDAAKDATIEEQKDKIAQLEKQLAALKAGSKTN